MWHNLYAKPSTNILVLVGCRVTSKLLGIGPSERNQKDYNHVQRDQRSRMQRDSSENQAILYGAAKMHKNSVVGKICVYNQTNMMVDMGLDNIVYNDREPCHARIFNAWIEDLESDILRTRYQENDQRFLQKYNNIRLLDYEDNQTYIIAPENLDFKGPTRRNKQYCVVRQNLNCIDGDNLDILISREIKDDFMVLIKRV